MTHICFELAGAASFGLFAHWGFFIRGEKDLYAANIARFHIFVACLLSYLISNCQDVPIQEAIYRTLAIGGSYATALFTSIVIYRLAFSPLRFLPGPLRMRITKLTHVLDQARYRNCEVLDELHKQYGDIVRTGSSCHNCCIFSTDTDIYKAPMR